MAGWSGLARRGGAEDSAHNDGDDVQELEFSAGVDNLGWNKVSVFPLCAHRQTDHATILRSPAGDGSSLRRINQERELLVL